MRRWLVTGILALAVTSDLAAGLRDAAAVPHLPPAGQDDYRRFLAAEAGHRAFAIAPGGAWGWTGDAASAGQAGEAALATCRENTRQKCVLYAVDDRVVFDAANWPLSWGPSATPREAAKAVAGRDPGQRFPDLAYRDAAGQRTSLAALRGKVTLVHFWGSWCAPCRHELPDLQKLRAAFADRADLAFVVLQGRERIEVSRQWAKRQRIDLPLADSGSEGDADAAFRLAGGATLRDRDIAVAFPTTYVLDRHGLVVFAHFGAVHDWSQYAPFLLDALRRSGK